MNKFSAVLLALIVATLVSGFSIPVVVRVTMLRRLTDKPGSRKIHKREIPTLGGIALYAGFSFGFLLSVSGHLTGVNYFSLAILLLFLIGMKDDLITLDPNKKLGAEIIAALLLLFFTDIRITSFHGFLGINDIPEWTTYITTIFILIVIINSINLIDGIDGLAASIGIIASSAMGLWFWLSDEIGYAIMAASLVGALIGFIRFNISNGKYKIFMGDTGSLLVGFIIAAMTIMFNEVNTTSSAFHVLHSAPAISMAILIIPLFDTLRVFTIRVFRGKHPFTADNRHIHHIMLRAGFTHIKTDIILAITNILIIAIALVLDHIGILWLSIILLMICILLTGLIYLKIYSRFLFHRIPIEEEDFRTIRNISVLHTLLSNKSYCKPVLIPKFNQFSQVKPYEDNTIHNSMFLSGRNLEIPLEKKEETSSGV